MRQNVRYQALVIPSKIRVEVRISVDDQRNPEYSSTSESGDKNVSLSIFPFIGIPLRAQENSERMENEFAHPGIQMII